MNRESRKYDWKGFNHLPIFVNCKLFRLHFKSLSSGETDKEKYFLVLQVIKTFNQRKNDNLFSSSYHEIFNSLCIELSSIFVSKLRKMSLILQLLCSLQTISAQMFAQYPRYSRTRSTVVRNGFRFNRRANNVIVVLNFMLI